MKRSFATLFGIATSVSLYAQDQRSNVLFILADDMRGSTLEMLSRENSHTPNLNKLAADGVCFSNAHIMGGSNGAVSMPSRAMIMTGKYVYNLEKQGAVIPGSHTTIGEVFRDNGYETFHIGKWHADKASFNRAFSDGTDIFFGGMADHWNVPLWHYDSSGRYPNSRAVCVDAFKSNKLDTVMGQYSYSGVHSVDVFTQSAKKVLSGYAQSEKPFFMSLCYMSPHDPRTMPKEFLDFYDADKIGLPENFYKTHPFDNGELNVRDEVLAKIPREENEVKGQIHEYLAMITHLDNKVGELIEHLKATGLYDNTIIVFTADNGLAVGQHGLMGKQSVYEHSLNVPLIVKDCSLKHKAQTRDQLCYMIDLYPTLCDMVSIRIPSSVDGTSALPIINDNKPTRDMLYYGYREFQRSVSDGEWKFILYRVAGVETAQLFNLKKDPMETTDLSKDPKYKSVISRMKENMSEQRIRTNDKGPFWASEI